MSSRRRKRWRRTVIALVILILLGGAAGYGGWWFASGRYAKVPNVGGEAQATAQNALSRAGFKHVKLAHSFSETVAKDIVIGTSPNGQSRALRDSTITLTVSQGRERFTVPTVPANSDYDTATALVAKLPVQVVKTQQPNDTVPAGRVVGTSPAAGTPVKRDAVVTIIVSTGPPVIAVPSVDNAAGTDAENQLTSAGFKYAATQQYSDTVPTGQVISQQPDGNSQAVKGSTVNLVISLGPQYVDIPKVTGKSAADASEKLADAGFQVKVNHVYGGLLDITVGVSVDDSDKNSSGQAKIGSTITIDVA
jgi:serine/threonine-protein kinase